ncbi:MAG: hypothetical protein JXP34_13375 [Planctomycetes bacterium]|nr:hypothetical protein [Planctomycetota bacterium]
MTWVLTTRWSSGIAADGDALIGLLVERGPQGIEIASGLPDADLRQAMSAVRRLRTPVISVCCPTPRPRLIGEDRVPEALDPDPGIRAAFIGLARRTAEAAHEAEARFVVLDLESSLRRRKDEALAEELPGARADDEKEIARVRAARSWRQARSIPDSDAAKRIVERLAGIAEGYGIRLVLPLRSGLHGFPSAVEAAEILREFRGGPVGVWFDVASAGSLARLGEHDEGIVEASERGIEGVRIHDIRGWIRHLPPGEGELDRGLEADMLRRFREKPCVLDVSADWDAEHLDRARERLDAIAFDRLPASPRAGFQPPPGVDSGTTQ